MKKNLEYYQHFTNSHNHPKFKMLRNKYGWEGEGKFWALNNIIASSEHCKLNLNNGYNLSTIAYDLGFSEDDFKIFLKYLSDTCKLIKYKTGVISTNTTQENYKKVFGDRLAARERKAKSLKKFTRTDAEPFESSPEPPVSSSKPDKKVNQTKVNQIKPNKKKLNQTKVKKSNSEVGRTDLTTENQDQKQKPSLNGKNDLYFNKFWKFYNRREGNVMEVRKVFVENIGSEKDFEDLIKATRHYNDLTADRDLKFMKLPINFLKGYKDFININR